MSTRAPAPIVDVCELAYDADCWRAYLTGFATDAPAYLRIFARRLAALAGADPGTISGLACTKPLAAVDRLVAGGGLAIDMAAHVAELRASSVRRQIVHGSHWPLPGGGTVNERLAELISPHRDLLDAWCGISLRHPRAALEEIDRCVLGLGMTGVSVAPFWDGVAPDAEECRSIFDRCAELEVPIWVHAGHNLASDRPMAMTTPGHLDRLAVRHPDLLLIAGHGGWPWTLEMVAVLQRHPNVYLEISSHRPSEMAMPGSGWEPVLHYATTTIRHKVLFGSLTWVHGLSTGVLAGELNAIGLPADVTSAWLHDNAARMLRLDTAPQTLDMATSDAAAAPTALVGECR
jgi:uncharacterized protein